MSHNIGVGLNAVYTQNDRDFWLEEKSRTILRNKNQNISLTKRLYAPSSQKQTHSKSTFIWPYICYRILKRSFGFARFVTVNGKIFLKHIKKANPPNRVSPLRILADLLLFEKAHLDRKIPSTWDQLVGNLQRRQNTSSIHTANADDQTEQPSWNFNIYHLPVLKTKYFWGDKNLDLRIINC